MNVRHIVDQVLEFADASERSALQRFVAREEAQGQASRDISDGGCGMGPLRRRFSDLAEPDQLAAFKTARESSTVKFWKDQKALLLDVHSKMLPACLAVIDRVAADKNNPHSVLEEQRNKLAGQLEKLGFAPSSDRAACIAGHPRILELAGKAERFAAIRKSLRSGQMHENILREADAAGLQMQRAVKDALGGVLPAGMVGVA